jgi:hypothetical protein
MRVRNWKKFQHFRDRKPPWIKLYRDLLDDPDWHDLDGDTAKGLLMLWLIASEADGELPSTRKLSFRLRMSETKTNQLLAKLDHWLEGDDITTISDRYQDDAPETETETETETESARPKKVEIEKEFLEFYIAYPKKVAKQDAAKAYAAARRDVSHSAIMDGLALAIKSDFRFREAKFTPYPASWLRDGCYEDEGMKRETVDPNRFKALPGSPQFLAWKAYFNDLNKPQMIRELNQRELEGRAFSFESQWPPGMRAAE